MAQKGRIPKESLKDIESYVNTRKFSAAESEINKHLKTSPDNVVLWRLLGLVYLQQHKYDKALPAYEKAMEINPLFSHASYFEYGDAFFKTGKFSEAQAAFNEFREMKDDKFTYEEAKVVDQYFIQLDRRLKNCEFAIKENNETFEIGRNLGTSVNSEYDDYMPSLSYDGKTLLYTIDKTDEDVYKCVLGEDGWGRRKRFDLVNSEVNDGMARFTSCGRYVYFVSCYRNGNSGGCDIMRSEMVGGELAKPTDIIGEVNTDHWDSQPSISCDGKTMYFTSNRPGGLGGTDIWKSEMGASGTWQKPVNLGANVNTPFDEESPYIANDGVTLYFSSEGHPGFGDADLYRCVLENGSFTTPKNLGKTFNSPYREVGFCLNAEGDKALFASDKPDGQGGLDIYEANLDNANCEKNPSIMIVGTVFGEDKEPLPANIKIGKGDNKMTFKADERGQFFICVPNDNVYSIIASHQGYSDFIHADLIKREDGEKAKKMDIVLYQKAGYTPPKNAQPLSATILYFETSKSTINEMHRQNLDGLAAQYKSKSGIKVNIVGFADEIGNFAENKLLSEKRAKAVADYLVQSGFNPATIKAEGKGEVNKNDLGTAANPRRVEVMVFED